MLRMKRGVLVWSIATPVIVLVALGGFFGYRWMANSAPFGASSLHAKATIEVTDANSVDDAVAKLGAAGLDPYTGDTGDQLFIGQVSYQVPAGANAKDHYAIVVIDKAHSQVAPLIYGTAASRTGIASGWQTTLTDAAKSYDWLQAAGAKGAKPAAVIVPANTAGPVTFEGAFPKAAPLSSDELLVALVLLGPDGHVFWAARLAG